MQILPNCHGEQPLELAPPRLGHLYQASHVPVRPWPVVWSLGSTTKTRGAFPSQVFPATNIHRLRRLLCRCGCNILCYSSDSSVAESPTAGVWSDFLAPMIQTNTPQPAARTNAARACLVCRAASPAWYPG